MMMLSSQRALQAGSATQRPQAAPRASTVRVCARLFGRTVHNPAGYNKYELRKLGGHATSMSEPPITSTSKVAQSFYKESSGKVVFKGVHHVALLCEKLERSMEFYQGLLGLEVNPDRPHDKLPYRGAWLWIGPEMIHLMELPNPDPLAGRPAHGGRDRHFCVGVESVEPLVTKLEAAGIPYTKSMSGRAAVFFRDPDMNVLECVELEPWR